MDWDKWLEGIEGLRGKGEPAPEDIPEKESLADSERFLENLIELGSQISPPPTAAERERLVSVMTRFLSMLYPGLPARDLVFHPAFKVGLHFFRLGMAYQQLLER